MTIEERYHDGSYLRENPTWDVEDSPWKAKWILTMLRICPEPPETLCDIGCGAGVILKEISRALPETKMRGFDISSDLVPFWERVAAPNVSFELGDFFERCDEYFDVILLIDLVEHLQDPYSFLKRLRRHARHLILHIPLDLSAVSVAREAPLLKVREKVGHLHYFTRSLALAMIQDCGYRILNWSFTGASLNAPRRGLTTRAVGVIRRFAGAVNRDWSARLLGGETLIVLAAPSESACG